MQRKHVTTSDPVAVFSVVRKYLLKQELVKSDLGVHFEVHLANRKGWQRRIDKGEGDLKGACRHLLAVTVRLHRRDRVAIDADYLLIMMVTRQPLPAVPSTSAVCLGLLPLALHLDEVAGGLPLRT